MGVPPKVQPNNIILALTKDWVILHSWVCHLKYSPINLYYLGSNKTLGYTVLMGAPPKVQPNNIILALTKDWVTLHSWVCHLIIALVLTKESVILSLWENHLKYSLVILSWLFRISQTNQHYCTYKHNIFLKCTTTNYLCATPQADHSMCSW